MTLKSNAPRGMSMQNSEQVVRLQNELRIAEEASNRLRQELAHRDAGQVAAVSLLMNDNPNVLANAAERKMVQEQAVYDVAQGLGVEKSRVEIIGMHVEDSRSLAVDLHITPPTNDQERSGRGVGSSELAMRLVQQGQDSRSPFKMTPTGQKTVKVQLQREQDYVYRLRKTVQMLQDEVKHLHQVGNNESVSKPSHRHASGKSRFSVSDASILHRATLNSRRKRIACATSSLLRNRM